MLDQPTHKPLGAFECTYGPKNARIAFVGEAFGEEEAKIGRPFVGYSGSELTRMLTEAGIKRSECLLTNVLALRPPNNNLDYLCAKRAEVGSNYTRPPLKTGHYLRWEFLPEIDRLKAELEFCKPNLVVALGNVACWALLNTTGISAIRGTTNDSTLIPGLKVLPTYHPAAILRQWSWRVIAVADLMKAKREMEFPEIRRPMRWAVTNPTFEEMESWYETHAIHADSIAVDSETFRRQIRTVGFAANPRYGICVPFIDFNRPGRHYWPTPADEITARKWCERILTLPCPKIMQNGMYDLQYLLIEGFKVTNVGHDTMLLHHALYPELPKSLGFLGSIYSNEQSWKLMRLEKDSQKRDE